MAECQINFVYHEAVPWKELLSDEFHPLSEERLAELSIESEDAWIFRTYHEFRRNKYPAKLSKGPCPESINFCMPWAVSRRNRGVRDFLVLLRSDGPRSKIGNFLICQNGYALKAGEEAFVPHWPQSGVLPRSKERGDAFENVTFFGAPSNLAPEFREGSFRECLGNLGLKLVLPPSERDQQGLFWRDYRSTDVALAVRRASRYDLLNKPATKLVNTWNGEVPAILGVEFGFREVRQSELDYLEASTVDEVLVALARLKASPDLRRKMVLNGQMRRQEFGSDSVFECWRKVIENEIKPAFNAWKKKSLLEKSCYVLGGIVRERKIRQQHLQLVLNSPRVTSY